MGILLGQTGEGVNLLGLSTPIYSRKKSRKALPSDYSKIVELLFDYAKPELLREIQLLGIEDDPAMKKAVYAVSKRLEKDATKRYGRSPGESREDMILLALESEKSRRKLNAAISNVRTKLLNKERDSHFKNKL